MSPWTEKHRPKILEDVKGQNEIVSQVLSFIEGFNASPHKGGRVGTSKKALLLHGPPGVGKTTIVHALAKSANAEIFELNASDLRNKTKLKEILKPATQQQSLIKKGKIILVDEVDGISRVDWGGISELVSIINTTPFPMIITANDAWDKTLAPLRKKCLLLNLKEIDYKTIKQVMIEILRKENRFIDNEILTKIAIKSKGDLRAAINDLQTISEHPNPKEVAFDERNKEVDIFKSMQQIFKAKPTEDTLKIFDSVNMPLDEIILWIEENIPAEYQGEELVKAINMLSKTDIFKGRIYKQQYWRFLVYENIFLSYGVSAAKVSGKNPASLDSETAEGGFGREGGNLRAGWTPYKKPTRILKIWMNNQRIAKQKTITEKYAARVHIGQKRALHEFPIIKQIINSNPIIAQELKLSEEEVEYLKG